MGSNNTSECPRCGGPFSEGRCAECGFSPGAEVDPWLGRLFGGFLLARNISEGPQGGIYQATSGQQVVAVKLVKQRLDHELTERLKREAKVIQRLQHPAVVKLLTHGETPEGYPFLVTEWVYGETLRERMSRGPLQEAQLLPIIASLCEALAEAHQKGIIHRDITPRNIMIQQDGAPRLLDFGFAALRGAETLTERGVVSGTPAYMSPEQWQGLANASASSDLYSLAVVAYQCLTGQLPLDAKTPLAWLKKHALERPLDLSELPQGRCASPALRGAIMRALQKSPGDRQPSIIAFARELTDVIDSGR